MACLLSEVSHLDERIKKYDAHIRTMARDFMQFRRAAQFGAWIGLTPRQHSSGGKNSLGGITKRGDKALALANKNARILWAVMTRGEAFNARHVSVKPGAATPRPATA